MNFVTLCTAVSLTLSLLMTTGCNSKPDTQGVATPGKGKTAVASPQDQTDARAAAQLILSQLAAEDFVNIYRNASPGFQKIGSEEQFVARFRQARKMVGALKNQRETSFEVVPNKGHMLVYRLDNDLYTTDIRLSFERAGNGKMTLAGLNQHDEPKKK